MKENENPSAFPHVVYNQNDGHWDGRYEIYKQDGGMTLRDYFAAKAITALTCAWENLKRTDDDFEKAANHAYRIADAMLRARLKK